MWRTFIKDSRNLKVLSSFLFELIIALVANSRSRALAEVKEPFEEKVTELRNCLENSINGGHGMRQDLMYLIQTDQRSAERKEALRKIQGIVEELKEMEEQYKLKHTTVEVSLSEAGLILGQNS